MPVFVDTNVLVYARDGTEADKQARARSWIDHLWRTREGRLSVQVLQEYYVSVTGKLRPVMTTAEARADVRAFVAWRPVTAGPQLLEDAWGIQERHNVSFWDAMIVAAAGAARCEQLLTEDLADGASYDGVVVANPFTHEP